MIPSKKVREALDDGKEIDKPKKPLYSLRGFWNKEEAAKQAPMRVYSPEELAAFTPAKAKGIHWGQWAETARKEYMTGHDCRALKE